MQVCMLATQQPLECWSQHFISTVHKQPDEKHWWNTSIIPSRDSNQQTIRWEFL